MLGLQQPAPKERWTLTHAASAGTLPEASNAHLAVEEDGQSDRTPNANNIHMQARGIVSALGATTPLTTVTQGAMDQLQLEEAWEQIRQVRVNLERRDLALTERRTVIMQEEYDIRNKQADQERRDRGKAKSHNS